MSAGLRNSCPNCGGMGFARGRYYWCMSCNVNFVRLLRSEVRRGS